MSYFTMSSVFSLPPLLFVTFHEAYGISYTLLGTLVLINYCTQLTIDLVFTVFSKYFNTKIIVRIMPLITTLGLLTYALAPTFFPNYAYAGLVLGTFLFSVSAGLSEVMLSPTIAAIPSDNPQRDMSLLHSLYAFGVLTMVVISTVFLKVFGNENWMYLTVLLALLPIIPAVLFMLSPMPDMSGGEGEGEVGRHSGKRAAGLAVCVACIFFGSCAENTMSNWIPGFMENALGIDKALGDILGLAIFAILLGLARISYAKYGRSIEKTLLVGMIGAFFCYIAAGLANGAVIPTIACILTGLFTSMLWPGTLIMMEEKLPGVGVAAFAMMASGGDLGAAVAPQLMGFVIDKVSQSGFAADLASRTGFTAEQIGMKAAMLTSSIFPLLGTVAVITAMIYFRRHKVK